MRARRSALPLTLLLPLATLGAAPPVEHAPRFDPQGRLLHPGDYRSWVYLSSGVGMSYGPGAAAAGAAHPPFDNVFVPPEAYRAFLATGHWPEHTLFVLEIRSSSSHASINKGGHFQSELVGLEAELKDSERFPERWGYFAFNQDVEPAEQRATLQPKDNCWKCHDEHAAVENTFVQFYPTLLPVAEEKGVFEPGYVPPMTPERWLKLILKDGWGGAEAAFAAALKEDQTSPLGDPQTLNILGYRLISAKRTAEAVQLLSFAAKRSPRSANAQDSLADAYEAAGDPANARAASERSMKLAKTDPTLNPRLKAAIMESAAGRLKRLEGK